jgi:hypothetical protein
MSDPFSADTIQQDEVTVTVEDLVGEGRKYKDTQELAKAYTNADGYINKQKQDIAERDAELKVLRDLVNARKEPDKKPDDTPPQPDRQQQPDPNERKNQDVDLNELVRKELSAAEAERRKADNVNKAAEVMNNHFGSAAKAQEAVRRRAEELGVGVDWLRDAASNSPNAFFATMGINSNARPAPSPGHNPEFNPSTHKSNVRDMSFYENVRKTDPKRYYSAEMRAQLMEDARTLGNSFFTNT